MSKISDKHIIGCHFDCHLVKVKDLLTNRWYIDPQTNDVWFVYSVNESKNQDSLEIIYDNMSNGDFGARLYTDRREDIMWMMIYPSVFIVAK